MLIKRLFSAVLASSCLLGGPAWSQPASPPAAPATASAAQVELTRRLIRAVGLEAQLVVMYDQLGPAFLEPVMASNPDFPAEWRQPFLEAATAGAKSMIPTFIDRMAALYATTFTAEELTSAVTFYESPIGRSVISKSEALAKGTAPLMEELSPLLAAEILKRFCESTPEACSSGAPTFKLSSHSPSPSPGS